MRTLRLSGGSRASLGGSKRAVNSPALVLADEPTGAADSQTSDELLALMRRLNREEDVTFVLVTRDMELAETADRMIRLHDGLVVSDENLGLDWEVAAAAA